LIQVLAPIDLDDELCFLTGEVSEVSIDRELAAELEATELPVAKYRPQLPFAVWSALAQ
jgi:hypothetical protein